MGIWGWWAFDIFTLMASYLSVEAVAAQTIMRSLGLFTFMIPVGFTTASGILIGQNVGAEKEALIKHYFYYCLYLSFGISIITMLVLILGKNAIFNLFTTEQNIKDQMQTAWPIFMVFVITDTLQGVASSSIRATGKQKWGAIVTTIAYWILGIPLAAILAFKCDTGLLGIWVGPTVATGFNFTAYMIIFSRFNWP